MKPSFAVFLVLLLSVFVMGQSDSQKTKIADIRAVMDKQAVDWNRGDIPAFMEGYWKSDQLTFVSTRGVTKGWQPTLDNYKKGYPDKAAMGLLTFSDLEITVVSKDAAVVLGSWSLKRVKDNPGGKFTLIFRKFKEGWRIVHDHTS
ncbi:MAG: DUF4440 domain-containing protein [Pyrinomonadaceae bacterium]